MKFQKICLMVWWLKYCRFVSGMAFAARVSDPAVSFYLLLCWIFDNLFQVVNLGCYQTFIICFPWQLVTGGRHLHDLHQHLEQPWQPLAKVILTLVSRFANKVFNPFPSQVCWPDHLEAVYIRFRRPRYLPIPLLADKSFHCIELCLYSVKNLIGHFTGVSLANLSVTSLEHLDSPLARANLANLGNLGNLNVTSSLGNLEHLENLNVNSAQQSLFNLTAIGSNFCHGTEQVCLKN